MRQSQKSNRSRGRGNRKGGGGGGNNLNRVYDSAGPEGKVRGTPQQIIDKYLSLARDAQTSGDRVASENFLQHAEHYQRILISAMSEQEKARREASAAATDEENEDAPASMEFADSQKSGGGRDQNRRRREPAGEIEGMTTIDSGDSSPADGLVVSAGEMENSQPRANGNGSARRSRRRPPKPEAEPQAPAAEPSTEAPGTAPEAAES